MVRMCVPHPNSCCVAQPATQLIINIKVAHYYSMGILAWIILGGVAGWIASLILGADASQGLVLNIVVGIVGAFLGGVIFNFFGTAGITGFNLYSLIVATVGATVCIWVVRLIRA